ncbi:MAG: hypothetical protein IT326_00030 [Anaerolineae bacterium]|nr:hypothetical protein [Anaerolineae bacterium]
MVEQATSRDRRRGCAGQGVYLLGLLYAVIVFLTGFGPFANDWTELAVVRPVAPFYPGRANCTVTDAGLAQAAVRLPESVVAMRYQVSFELFSGSDSLHVTVQEPRITELDVPATERREASAIVPLPPSGERRLVLIAVTPLPEDGFPPQYLSGCVLPPRGFADYAFAYLLPLTALLPLLGGAYLFYGDFRRPQRLLYLLTLAVMLLGYGGMTAVFLPRLLVPLGIAVAVLVLVVAGWWWRGRGQPVRP